MRGRACLVLTLAALAAWTACGGTDDFTPVGDVESLPGSFRWPASAGADSYLLQLFGTDGAVLFESGRLTRNEFPITDGLAEQLSGFGEFSWRVRIYDGDRIAGHSDRATVRLRAAR